MTLSKKFMVPIVGAAAFLTGAGAMISTTAFAASDTSTITTPHAIAGTVASISGNTITLTSKNGTTYAVDASSASIKKISTVAVSDIKVGDTLMVGGAVSGTNVKAEHILDGASLKFGGFKFAPQENRKNFGVFGTVSTVSASTLTIAAKNGTTYTVDISNAKVVKTGQGKKPTAVATTEIAAGDTVMILGKISGTNITAKMVIDGFLHKGPHSHDETVKHMKNK